MPTTRKKVIKTVYKDEDDSEAEQAAGDFSDSGSDAQISEHSSSEEDEAVSDASSGIEFDKKPKQAPKKARTVRKPKFAKDLINKINKQMSFSNENEEIDVTPTLFTVKDLTDSDKLLPPILNLSESDSSDDESPKRPTKKQIMLAPGSVRKDADSELSDGEADTNTHYKDVWSNNLKDNSEEIAKKTFLELEQHKSKIEETKASILKYSSKTEGHGESDVNDLLALGEEVLPEQNPVKKGRKTKKTRNDSESDMEDWEEVKEAKAIPQQGLQLVVGIPDAVCRKTKQLDIEMMMKRKLNRVKKEYQVYMHKVHVLCWLGHGNYVSCVLNDQEVLAAALSLVPSKECYPGERVDMKYVEQITTWYKDKLTLKQDKNEDKFRPKAPPLKKILLGQIKSRIVTTKKSLVFIFVSMLRALGLQSRVMFNFVTLPIKPPSSELCSLSAKSKDEKKSVNDDKGKQDVQNKANSKKKPRTCKSKSTSMSQVDGNDDTFSSDSDGNIMQVDGNNDALTVDSKSTRKIRANKNSENVTKNDNQDVSPPKRPRKSLDSKPAKKVPLINENIDQTKKVVPQKRKRVTGSVKIQDETDSEATNPAKKLLSPIAKASQRSCPTVSEFSNTDTIDAIDVKISNKHSLRPRESRNTTKKTNGTNCESQSELQKNTNINSKISIKNKRNPPKIVVTKAEDQIDTSSKYFGSEKSGATRKLSLSRRRSQTANPTVLQKSDKVDIMKQIETKSRAKSGPGRTLETSKYFNDTTDDVISKETKKSKTTKITRKKADLEDKQRVSHKDLLAKTKVKPKNDVTHDLVDIIKNRVKEATAKSQQNVVKGKIKKESDEDSDYLPEEAPKRRNSDSDDDFKPTKISPKPSTSRKIDRRVLSSDDEKVNKNKTDVWCEIFVEELEQWIAVDVIKGKVHCTNEIYGRATLPVCYVVGWDNNNYLKDLTRRYVPHWNTMTRKQRAEPAWWDTAVRPWLGPKTPKDREEDEQLNRMQLEAPLPKAISEYKNHPLYALKRHLLKFEALYPPDAATLGFVRGEPVYARECVHVCRSRDVWLKEAKVVRLAEKPYKIVKARPKWDRLSNKLITDKPLEIFGPWQVQDYEPPTAENGTVPRNAYGNVELFKECMLPKGTVHIKLPGLNRVAKKLNIDCAPAMTGFDFNGGWSHPVYDGFVVCEEFAEIITEAWLKDQEEQERKELEKIELRVYGNWKRLIKGLLIRERLKNKYGFEAPPDPQDKKTAKGPRLVVKKKN